MAKQISLSYLSDELAQVRTKKKEFLARIDTEKRDNRRFHADIRAVFDKDQGKEA